jgi:hypothetical protein
MNAELTILKSKVDLYVGKTGTNPSFDKDSNIPAKNKGIGNMFDFLKDPSNYTPSIIYQKN